MAKSDIFTRAKAYRVKHPKTAWTDCVKACAKKKVSGTKAPKEKKVKAVKVKVVKSTKGTKVTIGTPNKSHGAARTWGKEKMMDASKKMGLRLKHGYATEARASVMDGIAGISYDKLKHEMQHQKSLLEAVAKHAGLLKTKGMPVKEKDAIRREMKKYKAAVASSKKHVTALKKAI